MIDIDDSVSKLLPDDAAVKEKCATLCGYVAIIGRPNVGKSTLLNKLIGQKVSITSRKPQTTRHKILGIKTSADKQIVYVDTPGLHKIVKGQNSELNRYMNKSAYQAIDEVDVVIFVVEGTIWREEDEWVLSKISNTKVPVILAINKTDDVAAKERLLPHIDELSKKMQFFAILPISARKGTNLSQLEKTIVSLLPQSPFFYYPDQVTDRTEQFRVAEIIREKLVKLLGQELPYTTSVVIEVFKQEEEKGKKMMRISAVIFVERVGQKIIVIGEKGERLKRIGTLARHEIENILGKKVFLELWVKVKSRWTEDARALKNFGYN